MGDAAQISYWRWRTKTATDRPHRTPTPLTPNRDSAARLHTVLLKRPPCFLIAYPSGGTKPKVVESAQSASASTLSFSRVTQATASTCEPWLCSDDHNEGRAAWVPTWRLPSRLICSDWASRWAAARSPVPSAATICAIGLFPLISPDPLATNACARWALAASPSCIAVKSSFTPC